MKVKWGIILKKDPELYEVFDYFRKVLIDELDNADIETTEGQTIKTGGAQERRRRRVLRTNGNAGAVREGFVNGMDN